MRTLPRRPDVHQIEALFVRRRLWQSCLDIEATLAEVQAELGIVPPAAAAEIRRKARLSAIDEVALARDIERTRAPIVSLSQALAAACDGDAGGYVHWGATTQNLLQTGRTMLMRQGHDAFIVLLGDILERLGALAETSADMLMAGRTNYRHALPITFGLKVAGWIEELLRHRDRFVAAEPRVFVALWGGALGAMHAFGAHGPEINRRLSERLGLNALTVPSRAGVDHVAEYVLLHALLSATFAKIARDLYLMMGDEIAEVSESLDDGVVGSSTMPHKVNAKVAVEVIALAARLRSQVPLALEAMQPTHEGDSANNQMLYGLMDTIGPMAYAVAWEMDRLLACLRLDAGRMKKNLAASASFIAAENAMMLLAPRLGRSLAHELVHHAVDEASTRGLSVADVLMADTRVSASIDADAVRMALEPANYTGLSAEMARTMAAAAREAAPALQARSN